MARNDTEKSLKPRQRQAIAALLTEPTLTKAAEAAGVARVTLNRWLRDDPDFIAELKAAQSVIDAETMRRLVSLQTKALTAVEQTLDSPDASHSERLRAAEMVLNHRTKMRELDEIEERLLALEEMAHAQP